MTERTNTRNAFVCNTYAFCMMRMACRTYRSKWRAKPKPA